MAQTESVIALYIVNKHGSLLYQVRFSRLQHILWARRTLCRLKWARTTRYASRVSFTASQP